MSTVTPRLGHRRGACIGTQATDFRADVPKIDVPMLVLQGDDDQDITRKRLAQHRAEQLTKAALHVGRAGGPGTSTRPSGPPGRPLGWPSRH